MFTMLYLILDLLSDEIRSSEDRLHDEQNNMTRRLNQRIDRIDRISSRVEARHGDLERDIQNMEENVSRIRLNILNNVYNFNTCTELTKTTVTLRCTLTLCYTTFCLQCPTCYNLLFIFCRGSFSFYYLLMPIFVIVTI